jgi:hypothetical protein
MPRALLLSLLTLLLILPLLCCHKEQQIKPIESVNFSQTPKEGKVSFRDSYDENIYKETGEIVFNKGMKDVKLNDELLATVEGSGLFAYSIKNGQLTLSVYKYRYIELEKQYTKYTTMYTIDIENKTIKEEERLDSLHIYKDSDLDISIIGQLYDYESYFSGEDTSTAIMQYTWKGKANEVILSAEEKWLLTENEIYISEKGYLAVCSNGGLRVFDMDKKKFIYLGWFESGNSSCSSNFCIPLNEYVIYSPEQNSKPKKVYLYRYAEEELYATRYPKILTQYANLPMDRKDVCIYKMLNETKDTVISNMKRGNIYEQFLPLTRVENIDSMVNANSWEAWRARFLN